MTRQQVVLVTGAGGEMGHSLVERLQEETGLAIAAVDLREIDPAVKKRCTATFVGDITDGQLLARIHEELDVHVIFHLAALLSTSAEKNPERAHEVNVTGTVKLIELATRQFERHGKRVKFIFPSSIAAYGMPNLDVKKRAGRVDESQFNEPATMYGVNKLYCEQLGRYYTQHYRRLTPDAKSPLDFRSIRFPGLISAFTVPTGGTSDYGPEMIHAAAKGEPYACFVRPDSKIPFMAMPDAIDALFALLRAPRESLSRCVYNIAAFAPSADDFAVAVRGAFPGAAITFAPDERRQGIVDSWPEDTDDSAARRDWGFAPKYDFERTFATYLVPNIRARYAK